MPDIFVSSKKVGTKTDKTLENKSFKNTDKIPVELPNLPIKNNVHILSSFCKNPGDIKFQNQEKDEEVLLFVRRNFITNFPWVATGVMLVFLPFFFGPISQIFNLQVEIFSAKFILFFTIFYYLLAISYVFVNFIVWYFNISLVTTIRVVDVDFEGIVYKNVASTKLNLVQDVSYTQTGVFRTVFDYGDVLVQTAGEMENFDFKAVPRPEDVVHIVGDLIGRKRGL